MSVQRLFEIIRKEDAVLWVGAGFSKYAGYPTGDELAKKIYNHLTDEEKQEIRETNTLQEISQAFINNRGTRHPLIEILREEFAYKIPNNTKYHDILSTIPHIKTIITTNYDNLFENAYGINAVKIVSDHDITKIDENKTAVIKIHGDFTDEKSLVISQTDYASFINSGFSSLIWNLVIERVSTKSVIFLGYSMDDFNSLAILEKMVNSLGNSKKEMFFISPNIPRHKEKWLIQNGIIELSISGEAFVEDLLSNIMDNIMLDLENGSVSTDTYNTFTRNKNLKSFLSTQNKGAIIQSVEPVSGVIEHKISFVIKDGTIASQIMNKNNFENIVIPKDKIADIDYRIEGIKHPLSDVSKIKNLTLIPISQKTTMDISILDEEIGYQNISTEIYKGNGNVKIVAKIKTGKIIVKLDDVNKRSEISFNRIGGFTRPIDEIQYFDFLVSIKQGKHFRIITKSGLDIKLSLSPNEINDTALIQYTFFLDYFKMLRIIEKHYGIIFDNIEQITKADRHNVELIVNHINGLLIDNTKDMFFKLVFVNLTEQEKESCIKDNIFEIYTNEIEKANIHGKEIILGRKHLVIHNPKYFNLENLKLGEGAEVIIESKAGDFFVTYENDV